MVRVACLLALLLAIVLAGCAPVLDLDEASWSAAHDTILKEGIYECVTIRLAKEGVRR